MSSSGPAMGGGPGEHVRRWRSALERSPLAQRLFRGAFWSVGGALAARALGLVTAVVTARLLEREGFGRLGVISATLAMFQVFAGAGMAATATKYVAEYRLADGRRAGGIILLSEVVSVITGAVIAGLVLLLAPMLAVDQLVDPELIAPLRTAALALLFTSISGAQNGALAGMEAFAAIARISALTGAVSLGATVVAVREWGLEGAVWAMALTAALQCVLGHWAVRVESRRQGLELAWAAAIEQRATIWRFGLPAVLSGVMVSPVNWVATAILVRQPGGLVEMGGLNAANQWFGLITFLPSRVSAVVLPVLSQKIGSGEQQGARKVLRASLLVAAALTIPLIVAVVASSPLIMRGYGRNFVDAWPCLAVVALTAGVVVMAAPFGDLIAASGTMWTGFAMNAGWAFVFLVMVAALVGWGGTGALGLASARLIAYAVHAVWVGRYGHARLREGGGAWIAT